MRKLLTIFIAAMLLFTWSDAFSQLKIEVGKPLPEWVFPDADKKDHSMNTWPGKVLQINYVDPDESDLNDDFNDYVDKATDVDKRIDREAFKGFGIVDTKSTWLPNGIVRSIAGKKAKKYETTILFDYEGFLHDKWGMPEDNYTIVIADKNRICRGIYPGKIAESEFEKIVQMIIELTKQ